MGHQIVVTDTGKREFEFVLIRIINDIFDGWKLPKYHASRQMTVKQAKRKVCKFIDKYHISNLSIPQINIDSDSLRKIKIFYRKYPDKLRIITEFKLKRKSRKQQQQLLIKREDGYLPESGDLSLLVECNKLVEHIPIPLDDKKLVNICLVSNDRDFCDFITEIKEEFDIKIYSICDVD